MSSGEAALGLRAISFSPRPGCCWRILAYLLHWRCRPFVSEVTMKLIACTLPLLAGIPSVLSAQVNLSFPKIQRPAVRASLGPISLVASMNGHGVTVRAATGPSARKPIARSPRTATGATASAARVLATAEDHLGEKYVYGGDTPGAFDC